MEVQDAGQDMVASPATPGTGKSKLDTLPKEDLIKFAKKQMMLIQKVKSRCAELEKEVEELKSKPAAGGIDDIIQALTERLDVVLLEKAESQQQCLALKKESAQRKQEAETAVTKIEELQKQLEESSADYLKEIEALKTEIARSQFIYNEDLTRLQKELEEETKKWKGLMQQLELYHNQEEEMKKLQEEVQQIKPVYEKQILHLNKELEAISDNKNKEIACLQEAIRSHSQHSHSEINNLQEDLIQLKNAHREEVSELMLQLETSAKENEEKLKQIDKLTQDLAEQFLIKEKSVRDDLRCSNEESVCDQEHQREALSKNKENQINVIDTQGDLCAETQMEENVSCLERTLKELESQHSILKDELTYMSNVKLKLEAEIQHTQDEYFHEREDLEFKINELQLAKEDYCGLIEKLKSELQATKHQYEIIVKEHNLEIQSLRDQHMRDMSILKETLLSSSEKENMALVFEIQDLKEQYQKLMQEKEEAVSNYESLRETLETLQTELGESAGKISQEFETMRQQQASDVSELQQKLRAAFNEKDVLLETVNRLQEEAEKLSSKQTEVEEFKNKIILLQEENESVMTCLHQKQDAVKELEEKLIVLDSQKDGILNQVKNSVEEIENLQEACKKEQERVLELQQQAKVVNQCNSELRKKVEELTESLNVALIEKNENNHKLEQLEGKTEALLLDNKSLLSQASSLQEENMQISKEKDRLTRDLEKITSEKEGWSVFKEQVESLEKELQKAVNEKDCLIALLESEETHKSLARTQLHTLFEQLGSKFSDHDKECDAVNLLQIANEYLVKMKEEEKSLALQKDEKILHLQQEIGRLQEENEAQYSEHRSLLQDFEKEKGLLKEELEGALSEKEALQLDIQELERASEKARNENQDLRVHTEEIFQKLASYENQIQEQQKDSSTKDQENLNLTLEKRDIELKSVKAELDSLKDLMEKLTTKNDQQSSVAELQEKIVKLERESTERKEKLNKIKMVAVKAKKELDSSRKEVQGLREELELVQSEKDQLSASMKDIIQGAESYKNLLLEYDKQAEQLDFEKDRANNLERQIDDITKQFQTSAQQQDLLRSANEDLTTRIETLQSNAKLLEAQILEMQKAKVKVDKELEAEKLLKEQKIKDHSCSLRELEEVQMHLQKEKKHLQKTMQELELARKDAQKSTLMDMEIADYERFVKELNQKITDKNSRIEDLEQEIKIQKQKQETLQEEIKSLQSSVQQYEERNTKIKQLLVKTKKELTDSKLTENEHLMLQASLKGELEASQQQVEAYKIQVAELASEKHKVQEHLRTSVEQHQRMLSTYQQKITTLQEECSTAKAELATVTSEFESYKVRVHNVLKQQKNKSASQTETEGAKQEREHLEMMINQLKTKLQDTQNNLQINVTELQALQSEHDTLLERHNKMLQETVAKEAELREKLCTIQSENLVMKSEHAQAMNQLTAQNEALRNSFRDQVRHLQEEHRKTVETLQQQLSKVESQVFQLKNEPSTRGPAVSSLPVKNLRERRNNTDLLLLDMHTVTREEGEGMETTDTESVSSASTHIPSLEQLLNSPEAKAEPPSWQTELSKEELVQKLNTTTKSADHLNGLLRESEATNAILMEQIKLLKNEIRRLERNQEREKSVANLEYLKNVLLQFIFLKSGSERERLLPVIDTMLQLSPEEKGKLVAIAQGEEESASRPSGWASYLHSWSGLR
ncbi:GRIP and coiled-coil domain-containing protein 2 isoform X3 [Alligator sinensis]|uniref:GRIP and coiled-coil domain-containing protein 2 isoform X3 n=1 Tax=Alligator sinensis TaxID=38654 RepID=A0A1U7SA33_ALLSI|nr:GRIP and coiled-coil domain-containing protein 2 isoform X3 [Alligator sinensis]